jgi:hypothetical protein
MPDNPDITEDYETLLNYAEQGLEKIIPKGTKKVYSVNELLDAVHPDNAAQGEKMLALVPSGKNEAQGMSLAEGMNTFFELKPNIAGVGFNFNAFFDYLLNRKKK